MAFPSFLTIVLFPVQMPVMDGLESTRVIRNELAISSSELPILGITADYQSSEQDKYIKVGMNACIGKPVRFEFLKVSIRKVVVGSSKWK